jgi:N-formylglutamate deformylase
MHEIWNTETRQAGPVLAVALHDGHLMRPDLLPLSGIDEATRLREEDPFTADWTNIADIGIVATRSRFETDLNRPRDKAVYRQPEDAWGLPVWKKDLPETAHEKSLAEYDAFYAMLLPLLKEVERKYGRFFIYDLHSYNHRRNGPDAPPADPEANPEINIGTGTMDRQLWAPLMDGLVDDLCSFDYFGRQLDVRENVKFKGGGFPAFIHEHFPETGCAVAIEVKKFWMDEWSGERDAAAHAALRSAFELTVPGIRRKLAAR